jgi:hypothetical protein
MFRDGVSGAAERSALRSLLLDAFRQHTNGDEPSDADARIIEQVVVDCDVSLDPAEPLPLAYRLSGILGFWSAVFNLAAARGSELDRHSTFR